MVIFTDGGHRMHVSKDPEKDMDEKIKALSERVAELEAALKLCVKKKRSVFD